MPLSLWSWILSARCTSAIWSSIRLPHSCRVKWWLLEILSTENAFVGFDSEYLSKCKRETLSVKEGHLWRYHSSRALPVSELFDCFQLPCVRTHKISTRCMQFPLNEALTFPCWTFPSINSTFWEGYYHLRPPPLDHLTVQCAVPSNWKPWHLLLSQLSLSIPAVFVRQGARYISSFLEAVVAGNPGVRVRWGWWEGFSYSCRDSLSVLSVSLNVAKKDVEKRNMRSIFGRFASSGPSWDSCSPIEELQLRRDGLSNARRKDLIRSRFGRDPHGMVRKTAYSLSIAVSTMWKRLAQEMAMKCFHLRGMLHQEMQMLVTIGQELDFRNNFVQLGTARTI